MDRSNTQIGDIYIIKRKDGDIEEVRKYNKIGKSKDPTYECKCLRCGNIFYATYQTIKNKINKNCGCNKMQYDLTNKKFGKLTVLKRADKKTKHGDAYWECICDCGNICIRDSYNLRNNIMPKCNECAKIEIGNKNRKYKYRNKRLYRVYTNIKTRCFNNNNQDFIRYGKRNISICKEWLGTNGFSNFQDWALNNGYKDNLTIDRINNDGNYEPSNCRWVDRTIQSNNRRTNLILEYNNKKDTLANWSRTLNIPYYYIQYRIYKGKNIEQIIKEFKNDYLSRHKGKTR